MTPYLALLPQLRDRPLVWLVTGAAGFIGSNLTQALLNLDQEVIGLDNFETGHRRNLDDVRAQVGEERWRRFQLIEGDINDLDTCMAACRGVDYVLHQAALGSVPRSLQNPLATNQTNINGFLHMLMAARDSGVKRFVYAASSSTYGDHQALPKVEDVIGEPLSPYAVTKLVNELYAKVFARSYGIDSVGLRYFNVFGRRQDPNGAYAAVIPRWIGTALRGEICTINGDGETSRDFCFIDNVVQANLLAATTTNPAAVNEVYNVAFGGRTTLNELHFHIMSGLTALRPELSAVSPSYTDFRQGDVRHSLADITKAKLLLGYQPTHSVQQGLNETLRWYVEDIERALK